MFLSLPLPLGDERGATDPETLTIHVFAPATLRVALTPTNTLLLAWPAAATGYALQQNPDLSPTNWTTVTNTPEVVGSEKRVLIAPASAQNFYRLRSP